MKPLNEEISRLKEIMGLLDEEEITNQKVEIFSDGGGSEFADKYVGPIQKIPVNNTLPNEPFKDTSYMETSDNIKNMIQSINDGEELPPIKVIQHPYDKTKYNVVDGNHRRYAFLKSDVNDINAIVIPTSDVVLMKSEWGDENKDYIKLSDVLGDKKLIDKYFVKPDGTNNFEQHNKDVTEGEIEEDAEGGESAPSSPSMSKWESGVQRGKGNPIDSGSKWESGVQRGKGNPIW